MGMGVIVWLLIPLAAVIVAMIWTAGLARKERRRADERWRAQRLAELGSVLSTPTAGAGGTADAPADAHAEDPAVAPVDSAHTQQ